MYLNWGIDPSLDSGNDESSSLLALRILQAMQTYGYYVRVLDVETWTSTLLFRIRK